MYESSSNEVYSAKFSPLYSKYLCVLSEKDLQIIEHLDDEYKLLYVNRLGSKQDSISCIEWSHDSLSPLTIAAGFENGKVSLISYTDEDGSQGSNNIVTGNIAKEFHFKGSLKSKKKCNALAWSSNSPNLLAAGYDWIEKKKGGNQYNIAIWDLYKEAKVHESKYPIFAPYYDETNKKFDISTIRQMLYGEIGRRNKVQIIKEWKYTLNKKDDSTALAWTKDENSRIISGSHIGNIKLLDMQGNFSEVIVHKKKITGIKFSPFNSHIFGCSCEDQIKIFDLRKLKHPLLQINHDIKDFEFSNYHSYIIGTIHSKIDPEIVKFWNISNSISEEIASSDSNIYESKFPFSLQKWRDSIWAISWLPKRQDSLQLYNNRYLVISDNGAIFEDHKYKMVDTMPIDFSSMNELAFTNDGKIFFYNFMKENLSKMDSMISSHKNGSIQSNLEYEPETSIDDISELIVRRINSGYGLDIDKNIKLSENFAYKGIN